jgi:4-hydroxythreonine-4-phosphate dehydrogenase
LNSNTAGIALTVGDPSGIGPEIAASIMDGETLTGKNDYIIGAAESLLPLLPPEISSGTVVTTAGERAAENAGGTYLLIDTGGGAGTGLPHRATAEGGRISGRNIEVAVQLARKGAIGGIVTGPISKEALSLAGYRYRGHTGMLAALLDSPDCQMIMVNGRLRVVIMTRDIPLREVPEAVTGELIGRAVAVTAEGLKLNWGIENPSIAVAALNPHAGDGGTIGTEERDVIIPALERLKGEGFDITGPVPADTLFYRWKNSSLDACVAMYHDQGMIPFKTMGFEKGVNMTLGLPVVRTSVCHGTAYDLAGTGKADPGSLEAAIRLAQECIERRKG